MANIIPKPCKVKETGEKAYFSTKTVIYGEFAQVVEPFSHLIPEAVEATLNKLTFVKDDSIETEGYKLQFVGEDIEIFASAEAGALYGFMTLIQLGAGNECFDACEVIDKPHYAHRGFMLDCSRHFWSIDKIKRILDYLTMIKVNRFHWHLSDDQGWRIEIKKYPLLTSEKGTKRKGTSLAMEGMTSHFEIRDESEYGEGLFYTQAQAREIVEYAAARNIMVIPEIDMPGHFTAGIACYPWLSCTGEEIEVANQFGIFSNILCCAKPEVYEFAKDIIDELCEIFPAPYFHIGGDEVRAENWDNCPACQKLMKENDLTEKIQLQRYFNNIIIKYLKSKGKNTIGWNEILCDELDPEAIGQYWTLYNNVENTHKWINSGKKVILSQLSHMYSDYCFGVLPLSKMYNYNFTNTGIDSDENVLGFEMPQWTEWLRTEEQLDFKTNVRLLALSELGWTKPVAKNYENFEDRVEAMRGYFESKGIKLAPKRVYTGNTVRNAENMTNEKRANEARWIWFRKPNFEMEL